MLNLVLVFCITLPSILAFYFSIIYLQAFLPNYDWLLFYVYLLADLYSVWTLFCIRFNLPCLLDFSSMLIGLLHSYWISLLYRISPPYWISPLLDFSSYWISPQLFTRSVFGLLPQDHHSSGLLLNNFRSVFGLLPQDQHTSGLLLNNLGQFLDFSLRIGTPLGFSSII